jgi:hypothetical protein
LPLRAVEDTEVLDVKGGAPIDFCQQERSTGFALFRVLAEVIVAPPIDRRFQFVDVLAMD